MHFEETYIDPIPHVVHANGGIMMRIGRHVLGHDGAHPMDKSLCGILPLADSTWDRH
jgi:hypothetical protein